MIRNMKWFAQQEVVMAIILDQAIRDLVKVYMLSLLVSYFSAKINNDDNIYKKKQSKNVTN